MKNLQAFMRNFLKYPVPKFWILGCLLSMLLLLPDLVESRSQSSDALPVEAYWKLVEDSLAALEELENVDSVVVSSRLADLADQWANVTAIVLADGSTITLDTSFLVARLRTARLREPDIALTELESYFLTLQEAGRSWAEPTHDSQSLLSLEEILAQSEFQWPEEEPTFLDRIWDWISEQLLKLLARISPSAASGLGQLLQPFLTIIGIIILFGVLYFTFRGLIADLVSEADSTAHGSDMYDELLSVDQALQKAQNLSAGGDYRSAVRYLYLSSLLLLEEQGLIRFDRSQTNQEYLRNVAANSELSDILRDVIDVFDRVWYGFQNLDSRAYAQYEARVEELRSQI